MKVLHMRVTRLDATNAEAFEKAALACEGVKKAETWKGRAEVTADGDDLAPGILAALAAAGFAAELTDAAPTVTTLAIDGMTCHSCEITVERRFKKVPGMRRAVVDAAGGFARVETDGAPDIEALQNAVAKDGYRVRQGTPEKKGGRPSAVELAVLFAAVLVVGKLLSAAGAFTMDFNLGSGTSFLGAALLGLVAGSSSCLAVAGGLMLSASAKFRERYGNASGPQRLAPVALFIAGRTSSYALLGGAIGMLGNALTPSAAVTAAITLVAAAYMIVTGLDLLGLAPAWLKRLTPRMPKRLGHLVLNADGRAHPAAPAALGAATFFIPCGFTQALQLYALTTGSFVAGAAILGGFALGTAPALFALGWAAGSLKGTAGKYFLRLAGATVVVLGLWNVQNGMTAAGYPLALPKIAARTTAAAPAAANDPNVQFDGKTQRIRMKLGVDPFYTPSDTYVVRAGVPVRLEIEGVGTGCRSVFQIPKFGVRLALDKQLNVVEFTPDKAGDAVFSCAMGMFPGTITVVPNNS
jgi:sulfite exporter TauE/SafE/copper chaperone CopZ